MRIKCAGRELDMAGKNAKWYLLPVVAAILVACGGGGGGDAGSSAITGVAATGAPMANAPVFIKDASGAEPTGQNEASGLSLVTTDEEGQYKIPASALSGLKAPFILRVAGSKVLDSGDDATAILHAVVGSKDGVTANLTPLTEAATILTLGTDTATAFNSPQSSVANYTVAAAAAANTKLLTALKLPEGLGDLDIVSGKLDAKPTTDLSKPSAAKLYDMLLDTVAFSTSQGQFILTDRNRSEETYASAPQISISGKGVTPSGGSMEGVVTDGILDPVKLQAFIDRFNTQFKAGCQVSSNNTTTGNCNNVVDAANKIFSASYKHTGMTPERWISGWLVAPLDIENLGDVTVSLKAAFRGSFMATPTQRVTRVALKFARPNGDFVIRTMLLADEGSHITVFGNQKDYLVWSRPRLSVNTDADDTYPYNPKYQVGMQFIVKHWYAGMPKMIIGAHIDGPGLPTTRLADKTGASGESNNPNGLTSGIEVFQRTDTSAGCTNMAVDPRVYVEKNTKSWDQAWTEFKTAPSSYGDRTKLYGGAIRWRVGNTTCDPTFDMRRYFTGTMPTLPKRGDTYKVTLYLDANKWGPGKQPLPSQAGALVTGKVNMDGDAISYYPLVVTDTLLSDAFAVPTTDVPAAQLPGVTDATRARLLTFERGVDRVIDWTRNLVTWSDVDASGNPVSTNFGNFIAGVYTSSRDQMSTADNGYSFFNPTPTAWGVNIPTGFKDYREFFTTTATSTKLDGTQALGHLSLNNAAATGRLDLDCGNSVTYKGAAVRVRVRKVTNISTGNTNDRGYEEVSCEQALAATSGWTWNNANLTYTKVGESAFYLYDVVRDRVTFNSDKNTLVAGNQTSRTIKWEQMMAKESAGSQALCSASEGAWPYRKAYVIMADLNGRQIQESRDVSADFPGMTAAQLSDKTLNLANRYTTTAALASSVAGTTGYNPATTRSIDISRPNYLTDSIYLPFTFDVSGYDLNWTVPQGSFAWNPTGNKWHGQPGVINPAYEKASATATTCTKVVF